MNARVVSLNAASAGISRLREKGGARPDTLFDLVNGYVDAAAAISSRPGTEADYQLPPGTIGMCAFNGGLVAFSHEIVGDMPDGVICEVLTNPEAPDVPLAKIHFAGPFLGYLYVTAEFEDGSVHDYWLSRAEPWQADTVYRLGQGVQPTTPNGFTYRAHRLGDPGPAWAPNVERAVDDVVEPTEPNGFEYVVVEAYGAPPRSGATEPAWPTTEGALVIEEADVALTPPPTGGGGNQPPPDVTDRYGSGGRGNDPRNPQEIR